MSFAQPGFDAVFADADVFIDRSDIKITDNSQRIVATEVIVQMLSQSGVELRFVREFSRMIALFSIRKIAVKNG